MVQLKIAFLDEEEEYLEHLQSYLVKKKEMFFQVWTFQSAETFLECSRRKSFDAVVMTEHFWESVKGYMPNMKKILLTEGEVNPSMQGCIHMSKFQSAEKLLSQISALLWQEESEQETYVPEKAAKLIGIFSPSDHEDQILFSMTMAQVLGEQQKVLYLNLMGHSGFYQLTGETATEDVGDLVYGMMQKGHDFVTGLHCIRQSYRNFDYIPPVVNPEHLSEITKPLFEQLLMALKNRSGYDVVIVDFGMVFLGFAEMLPVFGSFYCLGKDGMLNRYRVEEFLEYLEKEGEHVAEGIKSILLPERMSYLEEGNLLENSLYGGMGDYIRRLLFGGGEIE